MEMKVVPVVCSLKGIPDYYEVYKRWIEHHRKTGNLRSLTMAQHYARVAEEMGQAFIDEDETITIEIERKDFE